MRRLLRHAAKLGVTVHSARLEQGVLGEYYADEREVYFDLRLTPAEQRSVLAHELGHAFHGHRYQCADNAVAERQADIYAARLLIDPEEYARHERVNPDQHYLAEELDVTVDVVYAFEAHCLQRVRGITYVRPKMGLGQWVYRAEVGA
ncbi:ImmA/IrrE family metallo-endopeptidase [Microbacterium sp. NPDC058389]|uniref:ImmA/IrrE family metallo-endopeptidase n=1 Tax=Microbacterium sp. NPDC058389 TaxID=3346475 RepID=UPI00364F3FAE